MFDVSKGGGYFFKAAEPLDVFTPEDFNTEHELIAETASGFVTKRVMPRIDEIDAKKGSSTPALLRELGELGLLAADIPEEY